MKFQPICYAFAFCLCLALASCGGSDDAKTSSTSPAVPPMPIPDQPAMPVKETTITATEEVQKIARQRTELLKQLTAVLEPLREPAAALAQEAAITKLFEEYNQLGQQATDLGFKGRQLAALSAHLAQDEWRDTWAEFTQYMLLVKQLGPEQRAMMERAMQEGLPPAANVNGGIPEGLQEHFEQLQNAAPAAPAKRPVRPAQGVPAPEAAPGSE